MNKRKVSGILLIPLLTSIFNLAFAIQSVESSGPLGVEPGDWIKYQIFRDDAWVDYAKMEFLNVTGYPSYRVTYRNTHYLPSGKELVTIIAEDVVSGNFSVLDKPWLAPSIGGIVIFPNMKTGDGFTKYGKGYLLIIGEETRTYAGATRTVVYANSTSSYSLIPDELTYYWDKQTGVLVEMWHFDRDTGNSWRWKATETNMWRGRETTSPSDTLADDQSAQWVKYVLFADINGHETQGWETLMEIQNISGSTVSGTIKTSMFGYESTALFSLNTETGESAGEMPAAGMVIPANLELGQEIPGIGLVVEGVSDRNYAGVSRRVVYANGSTLPGYETTWAMYWDQATGVLLEFYGFKPEGLGGYEYHYTLKATETNMWQTQQFGLPIDPTVFYALIIVTIAIVAATATTIALFTMRRKRKLPEKTESP